MALAVTLGAESDLSRQWPAVARTDGMEHGVWGRSRRLGWSEIERVSHNRRMGALVFEGRGGERIRASGYLTGVLTLGDLAERRLADRGGDLAAQALRAHRVKR